MNLMIVINRDDEDGFNATIYGGLSGLDELATVYDKKFLEWIKRAKEKPNG